MLRRPLHRSDLVWLGLIVAALALQWLLPDFRADVPTDSFRTGPRGRKALYLIADRLDYSVSRNFNSLATLLRRHEGYESDTALLLLGPARAPTEREWQSLAAFVGAGGSLVFAASSDEPKFDARPFNVSGKELKRPVNIDGKGTPLSLDLGDLQGKFSWQSRGELTAPGAQELVAADKSIQAVAKSHGAGTAVFVATDRPFDNRSLTWPDNAVLAVRLLEAAGWRENLTFDESLNVSGTPKVVALLLDRPLRPFTLHLFALLAAFGWWRSRRFGPLLPPAVSARSDIVAHADAVGMLYYRARDGHPPLRAYLSQLTSSLKIRRLSGSREDRVLDPIARRLGRTVDDVKNTLRRANAAAKGTSTNGTPPAKLDRAAAAKQIGRLAKIRRAARKTSNGRTDRATPHLLSPDAITTE